MSIKLNCKNFGYFAFNPNSSLLSKEDQATALALTILMGFFTCGLGHAICGITFAVQKEQLTQEFAKIAKMAQNQLHPTNKNNDTKPSTKQNPSSYTFAKKSEPTNLDPVMPQLLEKTQEKHGEPLAEELKPEHIELLSSDMIAEILANLHLDARAELLSLEQLKNLKMELERNYMTGEITFDLGENVLCGHKLSTAYGLGSDNTKAKKLWKSLNILQTKKLCGETNQEKAQWLALHYACGLICTPYFGHFGEILFQALINYARDGLEASIKIEKKDLQGYITAMGMKGYKDNHPLIDSLRNGLEITSRQVFNLVSDQAESLFNWDKALATPWANIKTFIIQGKPFAK